MARYGVMPHSRRELSCSIETITPPMVSPGGTFGRPLVGARFTVALVGHELRAVFLEGVERTFHDDEAEVLVFLRVHVVAQSIAGTPEPTHQADRDEA